MGKQVQTEKAVQRRSAAHHKAYSALIGAEIKRKRKRLRTSQKTLALLVGIHHSTISRIESGTYRGNVMTVNSVELALWGLAFESIKYKTLRRVING